jgi:hypothetical protein
MALYVGKIIPSRLNLGFKLMDFPETPYPDLY